MKILSIDVGIKNLAYCLFELDTNNTNTNNNTNINTNTNTNKKIQILQWDVIDLSEKETIKCCGLKNDKTCIEPARFKKNNKHYCTKHAKKECFIVPTAELKPSYINKQKLQKLQDLVLKYNLKCEKEFKKADYVSLLNEYIADKCFEPVETQNASQIDLVRIGKNIKSKFDNVFLNIDKIDKLMIENQISPIANRMKTIQGMIAQYFIMRNDDIVIDFVSASNKLKQFIKDNEKTTYSERKKLSITKCVEILQTQNEFSGWVDFFNHHKKKDDLADSFLQGYVLL